MTNPSASQEWESLSPEGEETASTPKGWRPSGQSSSLNGRASDKSQAASEDSSKPKGGQTRVGNRNP